jgi:hypothetical protein
MEEENVTTTEQTQPPSTLDRLEAITKRLTGGAAASAATTPSTPATVTEQKPTSKDMGTTDAPVDTQTSLQKNFEFLAKSRREFRQLGADRVLEDPRSFLRRRDEKGNYVVQDFELEMMVRTLMARDGREVEEARPLASDAQGAHKFYGVASKGALGPDGDMVRKSLDVGGGSGGPLIRTDLEQMLWEIYLRTFPVAERIQRVRSNGLVHSYVKRTAVPAAVTANSLGDFSSAFDSSTYGTASADIAIILSAVGIGLKLAAAVEQSGMVGFDLSSGGNLEVVGAVTSIAKKNQTLILQGNKNTSTKTKDDEEGATDANAFDGLRSLLKGATTSSTKANGDTFIDTLRRAAISMLNAGGSARNIVAFCSLLVENAINGEMDNFYRVTNQAAQGGFDANLAANGIKLVGKYLSEIIGVPADAQTNGMGYYNFNPGSGSAVYEDIDLLDLTGVAMAWLVSETPTILELPLGYNNTLARCFVPFLMNGLVCHTVGFQRKIRVPQVS